MARIEEVDGKKMLVLSEHEYNKAGLDSSKELELEKAGQGTWVLKEKKIEKEELGEAEARVIEMIANKSLSERVEGRFETGLKEEEQKALEKLVEQGQVIKFKLNPSYKKAVYKIAEKEEGGESGRKFTGTAAGLEEHGFMQLKNELLVKKLCQEIKEEIESGKVMGVKGFDGYYNIITSEVYEKYRPAVEKLLEEAGELRTEDISAFLGINRELARCVIEFLKEEGLAIEKKKDLFKLVA